MFIIISSDTMARSRCTSHRDGRVSPRLLGGHSRARTGPPTHRNCVREYARIRTHVRARVRVRERKKAIGSTSAFFFFFSTWTDISPPLSPAYPPFFRTARQDHQSASRGLLRGYATRSPPPRRSLRVPGEVSPIRSRQGSPFRPVLLPRQFP